MATDTAIAPRPARPPPWHDARIRGIAYQILFVAVVAAFVAFLVHNTLVNLRRQNIASGFGFLDREAAFGIGESLIVDRKSTRLNSSHLKLSRMPSSA